MSMHHEDGEICKLCDLKLGSAHPYLAEWFRDLKKRYINVHVSWSFRGEEDQNRAVFDGKSKLPWPNSPHNHMEKGLPFSLALDLFQIDDDGVGRWSPMFYAKVNDENIKAQWQIVWGGRWRSLGDFDHFELAKAKDKPDQSAA